MQRIKRKQKKHLEKRLTDRWYNNSLTMHGGKTMKCIKKNGGEIKRLADKEAHNLVEEGKAVYIKKQEWKKNDPGWKQRSKAMKKG